jgi:hypothetical protein
MKIYWHQIFSPPVSDIDKYDSALNIDSEIHSGPLFYCHFLIVLLGVKNIFPLKMRHT